jgi:hypothetical protein
MRSMRSSRHGPEPRAGWAASCIAEPPHDAHGIQASLLLLAASHEDQPARDGLYTDILLEEWKGGAFQGSYCDLHARLRERVMCVANQEPQIMMLGAPDLTFPLEIAFHLGSRRVMRRSLASSADDPRKTIGRSGGNSPR